MHIGNTCVYALIAAVGTCECRQRYFCVHTGKPSLIREWHLAVIVDSKSITSAFICVYNWFPLDTCYHNTHGIIGSSCICVCVYWPASIRQLRNGIQLWSTMHDWFIVCTSNSHWSVRYQNLREIGGKFELQSQVCVFHTYGYLLVPSTIVLAIHTSVRYCHMCVCWWGVCEFPTRTR